MKNTKEGKPPGKNIMDEIGHSIRGIAYGEVTIILHDSKIVQIERKEKKRFPKGVLMPE
jgi:hypothetical protein